MPKVGIYCRLSIEDRDKVGNDPSESIQNQKAMLRDYCIERSWEIYDIYVDDGFSGIDRTRPAFCRLLHDCEQGKIDIVLCKDQSRFSRDTVVIEQFLNDKFLEWGIRFIGVADNADTDNESYGTMRLFTSAYNEMYVKDISAKIRRTLAYKRQHGQFIGSFAPYGYRIDPADKHHLVVDPETAQIVKQIFDWYIAGDGYRAIVLKLNEQGYFSPTEYKRRQGSKYVNMNADTSNARGLWTHSTVAAILRNEVYTGALVQGRSHHVSYKNKKRKKVAPEEWVRIPDTHEAIIDAETWARAQERLNSNTRVGKRSKELSPLAGKLRCAVCGRPMKRNVYYNSKRTIKYYNVQCASYKTGAMNCPNIRSFSGKILEETILAELNGIVAQYCQSEEIGFSGLYEEQLRALEDTLTKLQSRQEAARKRLLATYKDKLDGIISEADYLLFRESLAAEEQEISGRVESISDEIAACRKRMENAAGQKALLEQYTHFDHLDRAIADEFIDFVEIGMPDENGEWEIHIHWKI